MSFLRSLKSRTNLKSKLSFKLLPFHHLPILARFPSQLQNLQVLPLLLTALERPLSKLWQKMKENQSLSVDHHLSVASGYRIGESASYSLVFLGLYHIVFLFICPLSCSSYFFSSSLFKRLLLLTSPLQLRDSRTFCAVPGSSTQPLLRTWRLRIDVASVE